MTFSNRNRAPLYGPHLNLSFRPERADFSLPHSLPANGSARAVEESLLDLPASPNGPIESAFKVQLSKVNFTKELSPCR